MFFVYNMTRFLFIKGLFIYLSEKFCFVCKFLAVSGLYESKDEAAKREEVLHRLGEVKGEIERILF